MEQVVDYWVFGYGSLMWDPGFAYVERRLARLFGYHRRFCLYSRHYRGTPERPGLVLALDRGGSCQGVAYRIAESDCATVKSYLWSREMLSNAYRPMMLAVRLENRQKVLAQCFVSNRRHDQYAGHLDADSTARVIASASGERGPNIVYLTNTLAHLRACGIYDRALERLAHDMSALLATSDGRTLRRCE